MLSKLGEIRRDDGCLDFSGGINEVNKDDKIIVYPCHGMKGNQQWIYNEVCMIQSQSEINSSSSVKTEYIYFIFFKE
jgi:hypothetical protein